MTLKSPAFSGFYCWPGGGFAGRTSFVMVGGRFAVALACALLGLGAGRAMAGQPAAEVHVAGQRASAQVARLTAAGHGAGLTTGHVAGVAAAAGQVTAARAPRVPMKTVRYRGYSFRVPRSWPVVDDRKQSRGCVRFDEHAVYLGAVRADQFCPSWLLGTTESILIQPGPARGARASWENAVAREITAHAPGIAIFATFRRDPALIAGILASASLPPPRGAGSAAGAASLAGRASRLSPRLRRQVPAPPLPAAVAAYRGLAFDACTAPSRSAMQAWRHRSPYRAIGIYIGGSDRACAQPNLSQSWVRAQARSGWRFIPLYAGPQAAFGELHHPVRQGAAAARDAVVQARRLGFGRGTPIYYDMEAYHPGVRIKALQFLSAWTRQLHRLHYSSGVYSSSDSGIVDLSRQYSAGRYAMPNVIYDALWNGAASTRDRNLRVGQWHMRRIHQFRGNVTQRFGGHTISIDKDYMNVRVRYPFATSQATSAVTLPDGSVDLFYRAGGARLWFDRWRNTGGWSKPAGTGAAPYSAPSAVYTGSSVDVFYKGANGYLWMDAYQPGGKLTARQRLTAMGVLGSNPRAIAQPGGVIDEIGRAHV